MTISHESHVEIKWAPTPIRLPLGVSDKVQEYLDTRSKQQAMEYLGDWLEDKAHNYPAVCAQTRMIKSMYYYAATPEMVGALVDYIERYHGGHLEN